MSASTILALDVTGDVRADGWIGAEPVVASAGVLALCDDLDESRRRAMVGGLVRRVLALAGQRLELEPAAAVQLSHSSGTARLVALVGTLRGEPGLIIVTSWEFALAAGEVQIEVRVPSPRLLQ